MIQVKVFDEEHEDDLTDVINDFLKDNANISVHDIKYATAIGSEEEETLYSFSALLIYSS